MTNTKKIESIKTFINIPANNDFPIENLPYGIATRKTSPSPAMVVVAIGEYALNLGYLFEHKLLVLNNFNESNPFYSQSLNRFASLGKKTWTSVRQQIIGLLDEENPTLRDNHEHREQALLKQTEIEMLLPFEIRGYTDFYASESHASNVGKIYRGPDQALMPNWRHVPIAYNGRANTVVPSGQKVIRPWGQIKLPTSAVPEFGVSKKIDFEVEIGFFIGKENTHGQPISLADASDYIFGLVLLNDWSARDIQAWEYQPLGPFLGKSFATTISPWVVPFEALQCAKLPRPNTDKVDLLPYLKSTPQFLYDINVTADIRTGQNETSQNVCSTNTKYLNWSFEQMLVHHASNGCKMSIGDLLGSGTISGDPKESWGSLLEITYNGKENVSVGKASRSFLEDGDEVIMRAKVNCGSTKIGFGECSGKIYPAVDLKTIIGEA